MDYNNLTDQWAKLRPQISIGRILSYYRTLIKEKSSMALCPFHDDHTPSMHVDEILGLYHCFSCGASGDSISFIRQKENCDFIQAVEKACDICGINYILSPKKELNLEYEKLFHNNEIVCKYFQQELIKRPNIVEYFKRRYITIDQITKYRLGYAPLLNKTILSNNIMLKDYDLSHFAGRIIFPILNFDKKIAGFGGRSLDSQNKSKYTNSKENAVFIKRELAYGMQFLGSDKDQPIYIVEGYIDVIKLQELGYRTIGLMGTNLSQYLFKFLASKSNKLVFALDNDLAGETALQNILEQTVLPLLNKNTNIFVAAYREKDPAESVDLSAFNHKSLTLAQYYQYRLEKEFKDPEIARAKFNKISRKIENYEQRNKFYSQWEKKITNKLALWKNIEDIRCSYYLKNPEQQEINKYIKFASYVTAFPNILADISQKYKHPLIDSCLEGLVKKSYSFLKTQRIKPNEELGNSCSYEHYVKYLLKIAIKDCLKMLEEENKNSNSMEESFQIFELISELVNLSKT